MENRKKLYSSGKWGSFKLNERYDCVCKALDAYNDPNGFLDEQDLKFIIKNAFVSKIYVSEGVASAYPKYSHRFGNLSGLYDDLVGAGILDLQDYLPKLSCKYFELCELGTVVYTFKKKGLIKNNEPSIRIEHVVPGNVYFPDVKRIKSINDFKELFDVVSICLVTDTEDKELSKKGLRQIMPKGVDYKMKPFARYEEAGIEIHGWDIDKGRLKRKTK
jgi:hypothetical protein